MLVAGPYSSGGSARARSRRTTPRWSPADSSGPPDVGEHDECRCWPWTGGYAQHGHDRPAM